MKISKWKDILVSVSHNSSYKKLICNMHLFRSPILYISKHVLITYYTRHGELHDVVEGIKYDTETPAHDREIQYALERRQVTLERHSVDQRGHHEAQEGVSEPTHRAEHVAEVRRADGHTHIEQHECGAEKVLGHVRVERTLQLQYTVL